MFGHKIPWAASRHLELKPLGGCTATQVSASNKTFAEAGPVRHAAGWFCPKRPTWHRFLYDPIEITSRLFHFVLHTTSAPSRPTPLCRCCLGITRFAMGRLRSIEQEHRAGNQEEEPHPNKSGTICTRPSQQSPHTAMQEGVIARRVRLCPDERDERANRWLSFHSTTLL